MAVAALLLLPATSAAATGEVVVTDPGTPVDDAVAPIVGEEAVPAAPDASAAPVAPVVPEADALAPVVGDVAVIGSGAVLGGLPPLPEVVPDVSAFAASCPGAGSRPRRARATTLRSAVQCLVNRARSGYSVRSLHGDGRLTRAAHYHARDMVRRHYFRHITRGDGPAERAMRAGYLDGANRWLIGETLAWGWGRGASAGRIVESWMRSPEHRRVLLRPDYRELGVGVVWGGPHPRSQPDATFTADFGVIG
jgi:uncharacterized protein YkwD